MNTKKLLYGALSLIILIIAVFVSSMLIKGKPQPKKDGRQHNIVYVKAEQAHFSEITSDMVYRGRITPFDNVALAAEVQGKIMQGNVRFKAGESFRKGDVLLRVYSKDVEAALKSGKSSFLQTLSVILPDLKVDYPEEYDKWNRFFNAINVEQTLPRLPAINSDKEKVFLAANNVLASYYNLQQQEINLQRYVIRAPFNGSFKTVSKEIGAVASPGAELATIIRTDKLEVTVPVFPSDLSQIKKGDTVQITDNRGNRQTATVTRIAGFVDEATQSVNVYLSYTATRNFGFLQGEYVDASFKGKAVAGFEIPREALVDESHVYELKNNMPEKREIKILRRLQDSYIIAGIDSTNLIIIESLTGIKPTAEYRAQ